jgi:hypothetical protein
MPASPQFERAMVVSVELLGAQFLAGLSSSPLAVVRLPERLNLLASEATASSQRQLPTANATAGR